MMSDNEKEVIDGLCKAIAQRNLRKGRCHRGEENYLSQDTIDDETKQLEKEINMLREIRQQLEDLFAGV